MLLSLVMTISVVSLTSCNSCSSKQEPQADSIIIVDSIYKADFVEKVIALDKEYLFNKFDSTYEYYETTFYLKDFLDSDSCDASVEEISSIFQVIVKDSITKEEDPLVFVFDHPNTNEPEPKHTFVLDNYPLVDGEVILTFEQAFEKIQEVNAPKPHAKYCVLRKEFGLIPCDAQYIFGSSKTFQLYVNAKTGEVTNQNPAYPSRAIIRRR